MSLIIGISQGNNKQRPAEPFPVADLSSCRETPFCKRAREQTIATRIVAWGSSSCKADNTGITKTN